MTDILKSGEKFAKAEGTKAAEDKKTSTAITFEGEKGQGAKGSITVGLEHTHDGEKVDLTLGAWFRQEFHKDGSSGGFKGKVEF
jgi:hypothetical protein